MEDETTMLCPNCGYENAQTSRFCRQCGTALTAAPTGRTYDATPVALSEEDAALQEDLVTQHVKPSSAAAPSAEPARALCPASTHPATLAAPLAPGTDVEGYTIKDLRDERDGTRTYHAQAPTDVCSQCGTPAAEPGAKFCEECGAELAPQDVLLIEQPPDGRGGAAYVIDLPDEPIKALLPPVNAIEHDGKRYLVVEETVRGWQSLAELLSGHGDAPDQPAALEEADALPIALQLAELMQFLHRNKLALGDLSLAQLLVARGRVRLRDVSQIEPLTDATRQADLLQLHHTLEDLTRTPRETRKLDPSTLEGTGGAPTSLQEVLAQARIGALTDADAWVTALTAVRDGQRAVVGLTTAVAAMSNVGMVRELNEDSLLTLDFKLDMKGRPVNGGIYVVADGMGGHEGGEVASSLAVQSMANVVTAGMLELMVDSDGGLNEAQLNSMALAAAERANMAVYEEAKRRNNDMGTTLTFALVVGDRCLIGNVGDSRTYLMRDGQLQRISKDHSLVQRLVDVGQIQPDDIYTHPHRNAILRSLGEKPQVEVDLFPVRLEPGDIVFCCSDGQWEMVRDPRLREIIAGAPDLQAAVTELVAEGNKNGGEDNISAVLVRFG
jgi:protein phosphatase